MLKSELMSSTQMIEKPDATDKPDTVLETEEGCIHKGRTGYKIVGRIIIAGSGYDDNARRITTLKSRDTMIGRFISRIFSRTGARKATARSARA